MISWGIILAFIYWGLFKGLRLTAGRRQRNGRTRSLVVRMMRTVGPAWGNVGLSWRLCGPILRPMSADLEAYVWAPCWPMLSQKIRKMGTARKHCKTQDILMVGGLSWGYVDPSWGYVGVSWGQRGPILGLCWPILRAMWAHLGAMLGPSGADVGAPWGYIGAS